MGAIELEMEPVSASASGDDAWTVDLPVVTVTFPASTSVAVFVVCEVFEADVLCVLYEPVAYFLEVLAAGACMSAVFYGVRCLQLCRWRGR